MSSSTSSLCMQLQCCKDGRLQKQGSTTKATFRPVTGPSQKVQTGASFLQAPEADFDREAETTDKARAKAGGLADTLTEAARHWWQESHEGDGLRARPESRSALHQGSCGKPVRSAAVNTSTGSCKVPEAALGSNGASPTAVSGLSCGTLSPKSEIVRNLKLP